MQTRRGTLREFRQISSSLSVSSGSLPCHRHGYNDGREIAALLNTTSCLACWASFVTSHEQPLQATRLSNPTLWLHGSETMRFVHVSAWHAMCNMHNSRQHTEPLSHTTQYVTWPTYIKYKAACAAGKAHRQQPLHATHTEWSDSLSNLSWVLNPARPAVQEQQEGGHVCNPSRPLQPSRHAPADQLCWAPPCLPARPRWQPQRQRPAQQHHPGRLHKAAAPVGH